MRNQSTLAVGQALDVALTTNDIINILDRSEISLRWATMIHFDCQGCGKAIKTRPELVGKKVKCPGCGTVSRVPADAASPVPSSGDASVGPNDVGSSRYHLIRAVEASLKRLGTDWSPGLESGFRSSLHAI